MVSKENVNVRFFPKNAKEAISFEYMKRRTSESSATVEDMVDTYFDARNAVDAAFQKKQQESSNGVSPLR